MDRKRLEAMQAGRERWAEEERQKAIERVAAFVAWVRDDSALWSQYRKGLVSREERIARQPRLPLGLPSDGDFEIARAATPKKEGISNAHYYEQ